MIGIGMRVCFRAENDIYFFNNGIEIKSMKQGEIHKGILTQIKTHIFFFIKRKNPVYIIDGVMCVEKVKPIIRGVA